MARFEKSVRVRSFLLSYNADVNGKTKLENYLARNKGNLDVKVTLKEKRGSKFEVIWQPVSGPSKTYEFDEDSQFYRDKKVSFQSFFNKNSQDVVKKVDDDPNYYVKSDFSAQYLLNAAYGVDGGPSLGNLYSIIYTKLAGSIVCGFQNIDREINDEEQYKYDYLINEAILTRLKEERQEKGTTTELGSDDTAYEVVQDPWQETPPLVRNYSHDSYFANNGSEVKIRWMFKGVPGKVRWSYNDVTTPEQKASGIVGFQITTNEPGKPPAVLTYSRDKNPYNPGTTPSFGNMLDYWLIQEDNSMSVVSYTFNNIEYKPPGKEFEDTQGDEEGGGRRWSNKDGTERDQPLITKKSAISLLKYRSDNKDYESKVDYYKYVEVLGKDEVFYVGPNELVSFTKNKSEFFKISASIKDTDIIGQVQSAWNNKVPQGPQVIIGNNPYPPESQIAYNSPFGENPPPPGPSPSVAEDDGKTKLLIKVPDGEFFPRTDLPDFVVYIGEQAAKDDDDSGFVFVEEDELLDEEYRETQFEGQEEFTYNEIDDVPSGPEPPSNTSDQGNNSNQNTNQPIVETPNTPPGEGPKKGSKLLVKAGNLYYIVSANRGIAGHRLQNVWTDLTKFLNANGFPKAKLSSNGITRDLVASTYPSSPARAIASLHGPGLAVDIAFSIPGFVWKGSPDDNHNLCGDGNPTEEQKKLTKAIWAWAQTQKDLTWGGTWGGSKPSEGIILGRGITEYHHFEIKASLIADYWKPFEKELAELGFDYKKLNSTGSKGNLLPLNKALLKIAGVES